MATVDKLRKTLQRIDGRGYKAYKDIQGSYDLGECTVAIDDVQGDPFAAPSRLRVIFNRRDLTLPPTDNRLRRVALEDYLARLVRVELRNTTQRSG